MEADSCLSYTAFTLYWGRGSPARHGSARFLHAFTLHNILPGQVDCKRRRLRDVGE